MDAPPPSRLEAEPPRLWIALARPDSLVDALAIAALARGEFGSVHLLYEQSHWWDRASWDDQRDAFTTVTGFERVRTGRGLADLPRQYRQLVARQKQLAALRIASRDVIVCLSAILGLVNGLASAYPLVARVIVIARKKYDDMSRPPDWLKYRHTTSSWFQYHLLEPMAGVGRTLQLKPRRNRGGDGVRLTRLAAPLDAVFQAAVVMSNTGRERPKSAPPSVFASTFPTLSDCAAQAPGSAPPARRRAVFFGTPFKLVENLPAAEYAPILNRCFDYLRRHYGATCELVYRPHPAETDERASLRMDGFTVETDQEVAQLYFFKHFAAIEAVYSVSSTVSRVAYNYGLNAYAFWPCFPFPEHSTAYFKTLMDEVPPEFEIRSLETPPAVYAGQPSARDADRSFAAALHAGLRCARAAKSGCAGG